MRTCSRLVGGVVYLGVAAMALVACGGGLGDNSATSGSGGAGQSLAAPDQPSAPPADIAVQQKIVVTTTLDLRVDKIASAYTSISQLARTAGGYIAESSVSGDDRSSSASVRIRVPASAHDDVVASVKALSAKVLRESTNAREVTGEYTDLQSQLRNLQRNEAQYQTLLSQARTLDEVLNVNTRLETVRGQIEQTQGRINLMDDLADFATINVSLSLPPPPGAQIPDPLRVLVGAWHFSERFALVLANLAVILAVTLLWLLPFGALGIGSWRAGRKLAPAARRLLE